MEYIYIIITNFYKVMLAIINFIKNNDNFIVALSAPTAFIVYWMNIVNKKKMAATLIINQIDNANKIIEGLEFDKNDYYNKNAIIIYNMLDILQVNYWDKYKYLFMKKLESPDIKILDQYYSELYNIQKAKDDISEIVKSNWKTRAFMMNDLKKEDTIYDIIDIENRMRELNGWGFLFVQQKSLDLFEENIEKYKSQFICNSFAYKYLYKMSYKSKHKFSKL